MFKEIIKDLTECDVLMGAEDGSVYGRCNNCWGEGHGFSKGYTHGITSGSALGRVLGQSLGHWWR